MKRAFGMAPHLIRAGHDVTICLEDAPENRQAMSSIPGCKALWFSKSSVWGERRQKRELLRQATFDYVHFCGLGWRNILLPVIDTSVPAVMEHTELESTFLGTSKYRRIGQWLLEYLSLYLYPNSIVVSKYLDALFRERLRSVRMDKNILYLPFASDATFHHSDSSSVPELLQERGDRKILTYMGNLYPAYAVFEILQALSELRTTRQDWIFCYIGDGPARGELEKRVRDSNLEKMVRFTGRLSESQMAPYMNASSAFISPLQNTITDQARCPGKTFIYMMFEKPIVTCRIGEAEHALGDDGFYYTAGDPVSMCTAIHRALDASPAWRPRYDPSDHTWAARAGVYSRWLSTLRTA